MCSASTIPGLMPRFRLRYLIRTFNYVSVEATDQDGDGVQAFSRPPLVYLLWRFFMNLRCSVRTAPDDDRIAVIDDAAALVFSH
jgi:hypothetical protein